MVQAMKVLLLTLAITLVAWTASADSYPMTPLPNSSGFRSVIYETVTASDFLTAKAEGFMRLAFTQGSTFEATVYGCEEKTYSAGTCDALTTLSATTQSVELKTGRPWIVIDVTTAETAGSVSYITIRGHYTTAGGGGGGVLGEGPLSEMTASSPSAGDLWIRTDAPDAGIDCSSAVVGVQANDVLCMYTTAGGWSEAGVAGGTDNLGNHTATTDLLMGANSITLDALETVDGRDVSVDGAKLDNVVHVRDVGGAAGIDQTDIEAAIIEACTVGDTNGLRFCKEVVLPAGDYTITDTINVIGAGGTGTLDDPTATNSEYIWGLTLRGSGGTAEQANSTSSQAIRCGTNITWDGAASDPMMWIHGGRNVTVSDMCFLLDGGMDGVTPASHGVLVTADSAGLEVSIGVRLERILVNGFSNGFTTSATYSTACVAAMPWDAISVSGLPSANTDQVDNFVVQDSQLTCHYGMVLGQGAAGGVLSINNKIQYSAAGYYIEDSDLHIEGGYLTGRASIAARAGEQAVCDATEAGFLIGDSADNVTFMHTDLEADCGVAMKTIGTTRDNATAIFGSEWSIGGNGQTEAVDYTHRGSLHFLASQAGIRNAEDFTVGNQWFYLHPGGGRLDFFEEGSNVDDWDTGGIRVNADAFTLPGIDHNNLNLADDYAWTGSHDFTGGTITLPADSIGIDELDLIDGATLTNGLCLTYSTSAGGSINLATCGSGGGDVATDSIWTAVGQLAIGTGSGSATVLNPGAAGLPLVSLGAGAPPLYQALTAAGIAADAVGTSELDMAAAFQFSGAWNSTALGTVDFAGPVTATSFESDAPAGTTGGSIELKEGATATNGGTPETMTLSVPTSAAGMTDNVNWIFPAALPSADTQILGISSIAAPNVVMEWQADGGGLGEPTTFEQLNTNSDIGFGAAQVPQGSLTAPLASPTFTGTVTVPSPFTIGATSLTATAAELNQLSGVTLSGTNSGDVTVTGTPDYITIADQVITLNAVDLAADVTGTLPAANGGTGITSLGTGVSTSLGVNIGNTANSLVTINAIQTLSNKTLTSPTISDLSNVSGSLALGTGTISGAVDVDTTDGTSPDTIAAVGNWVFTDDSVAYELDLPALSSGASVCIYSPTAHAITIDPNASEVIVLDGVAETGGEAIVQTTPTAGDFICLLSNGTNWYALGKSGDWDGAVD